MMKRRGAAGSSARSTEIVDQGLHGVFRSALDQTEWMLFAAPVDAHRRHEGHVLLHVNAVDLNHQQIETGKISRHPFLQPSRLRRDKMPRGGGFRQIRAFTRQNVAFGKPNRTLELACRDVDQHLVHRPLAKPVLALRRFPTGDSQLLAVETANARAFDLHLAAVKADLAFRLAPAMRPAVLAARVRPKACRHA